MCVGVLSEWCVCGCVVCGVCLGGVYVWVCCLCVVCVYVWACCLCMVCVYVWVCCLCVGVLFVYGVLSVVCVSGWSVGVGMLFVVCVSGTDSRWYILMVLLFVMVLSVLSLATVSVVSELCCQMSVKAFLQQQIYWCLWKGAKLRYVT